MDGSDPADLFVHLWLAMSEFMVEAPASQITLDGWLNAGLSDEVRRGVLRNGRLPPMPTSAPEVLSTLVGLDGALVGANPWAGSAFVPDGLRRARDRYTATGRLDSGNAGALLLPRRSFRARPLVVPETWEHYLEHHLCVPDALARHTSVRFLTDEFDLPAARSDLEVAAVPFIASLDDLSILSHTLPQGSRGYSGGPRVGFDWATRVPEALAALDASGAHIGLIPEMGLDNDGLGEWRRVLSGTPSPHGSRLSWILVGSGPVDAVGDGGGAQAAGDGSPLNRAVLLDRRGMLLTTQDKQNPFSLTAAQVRDYGLEPSIGPGAASEYVDPGRGLALLESSLGRFGVHVCEDLGRVLTAGAAVLAHGVSHLMVPLFAPPIAAGGWAERGAEQLLQDAGCSVAVCNSHAVARYTRGGEDATTLLVVRRNGGADGATDDWDTSTTHVPSTGDHTKARTNPF